MMGSKVASLRAATSCPKASIQVATIPNTQISWCGGLPLWCVMLEYFDEMRFDIFDI